LCIAVKKKNAAAPGTSAENKIFWCVCFLWSYITLLTHNKKRMEAVLAPLWSDIMAYCPKSIASVIASVGRQQRLTLDRNKSANHPLFLHAGPICFTYERTPSPLSSSSSGSSDSIDSCFVWVDSAAPAKVRADGAALLHVAAAALRLSTWWWSWQYQGLLLSLGAVASLDGVFEVLTVPTKMILLDVSRSNMLSYVDALRSAALGFGLRSLTVRGTQIQDDAMYVIGSTLPLLEHLDVGGCMKLTDLNPLATLTNLRKFNLSNCHLITTSSIGRLTTLSKLEFLSANVCKSLESLNPLLTSLALRDLQCTTTKIDSDGIQCLGDNCALLERLTLANSPRVKDLRVALRLGVNITFLSLNGCFVTDEGVSLLRRSTPQLQELSMSSCSAITQLDFIPPSVRRLDISRCAKLTDNAMASLRVLQCLEILNVSDIEAITTVSCLAGCCKLQEVDLSFTGIHSAAAFVGWDAGPISQSIKQVELEACRVANRHEVIKIFSAMRHQSDRLLNWA
jgi:hypothetical protein